MCEGGGSGPGGLRWHSEVATAKGRGGGWQRWQHEGKGDAEERGTRGKGRWQREERPAEVVARREPQGRLEVTGRREVTGRVVCEGRWHTAGSSSRHSSGLVR